MATDFPKWLMDNARPLFRPETPDITVDWALQICMQTSLKAALDSNRTLTRTDFRAELARITVPALIVHGDADVSAPLDFTGRRTQALIKGSQLKVYEGGPHGLFYTHREQFTRDLAEFIRPTL